MSEVAEPSNADIMRMLGEIAGRLEGVFRELDNASKSRNVLHNQMEETTRSVGNLQFNAEQQVGINAQIREEIKALHQAQIEINNDIRPVLDLKDALPSMVETWRDMSKWSKRFVYLLGIGGVSVVGTVIWFGGLITQAVKHWLGLPTS